jgi:sulfate transport system permease protein
VTIARTITWRTVRWAVAYGVTLSTARVIGEYGAVLIVSGNIAQRTQTLTLNIAQNFDNFDSTQGFAGAALLTASALVLLALLGVANERERRARGD